MSKLFTKCRHKHDKKLALKLGIGYYTDVVDSGAFSALAGCGPRLVLLRQSWTIFVASLCSA
jgi:hypothetical protein